MKTKLQQWRKTSYSTIGKGNINLISPNKESKLCHYEIIFLKNSLVGAIGDSMVANYTKLFKINLAMGYYDLKIITTIAKITHSGNIPPFVRVRDLELAFGEESEL